MDFVRVGPGLRERMCFGCYTAVDGVDSCVGENLGKEYWQPEMALSARSLSILLG